jgi:hypothetical protein
MAENSRYWLGLVSSTLRTSTSLLPICSSLLK